METEKEDKIFPIENTILSFKLLGIRSIMSGTKTMVTQNLSGWLKRIWQNKFSMTGLSPPTYVQVGTTK